MEAIKLRIQEVRLKRPDIISKIFWRPRKGSFKGNIALKVFGSHWVLLSLEEVASLMEEVKLEANKIIILKILQLRLTCALLPLVETEGDRGPNLLSCCEVVQVKL